VDIKEGFIGIDNISGRRAYRKAYRGIVKKVAIPGIAFPESIDDFVTPGEIESGIGKVGHGKPLNVSPGPFQVKGLMCQ
jgi:hypothetical protein